MPPSTSIFLTTDEVLTSQWLKEERRTFSVTEKVKNYIQPAGSNNNIWDTHLNFNKVKKEESEYHHLVKIRGQSIILKYVSKISALSVGIVAVSRLWISFEFQFSKGWKSFFPRDLQLSKFGKWNYHYCGLRIWKIFQVCYVGYEVMPKDEDILYQFWVLDWMNLNEYKGWSVCKSPSSCGHNFICNTAKLTIFTYL